MTNFFQLVVKVIQSVLLIRLALTGNAEIHAELIILVVEMLNALHNFTKLFALASPRLKATHTLNAVHMNALLIQTAQQHWNAGMKSVLIHVNVLNMLNVLHGTMKEFALAYPIILEIPMELHADQV